MKQIIIAGAIILAVFLVVLSQIPLGIEPLTELYFENHTELPKHIFLNKDYGFSFTVHNLEEQDMNYSYLIEAFDEENQLLFEIGRNDFFLENKGYITFNPNFKFDKKFDRAKINIKIIKIPSDKEPWFKKKLWWDDPNYPNEIDIHLWVEEIVGTTITITDD